MKKWRAILPFILMPFFSVSQELFPNTESASNLPKGGLDVKMANEFYSDEGQFRIWQGYSFAYGITSKIMLTQTFSFDNHHGYYLPGYFVQKSNNGDYITPGYKAGIGYPYNFENMQMELKYRFLARDGEKKHFRMAVYLQAAGGNEPHLTSEIDLSGDNSGLAGGIIGTFLYEKMAIAGSMGILLPHPYIQSYSNTRISYGNAVNYNLSFGYLLLPRKYTNYKQLNVDLYLEITGENYNAATIIYEGKNVNSFAAPSLAQGYYIDTRPGIQFILYSDTRLDFSLAYLFAGHSYERNYPLYYFNIQHIFYL